MSAPAKILLIEDDSGIAESVGRVLRGEGHDVTVEHRGDDGLARAAKGSFNLVITDLRLPGLSGLDLIRQLRAVQPRLPIILSTAFGTAEIAIEATKIGAYDYLLKPFDIPQLLELVQKAADCNRLMAEPVGLGEANAPRDALIGDSPAMQAIYKLIGLVAAKRVSVLIRGETGTGKELIARAIYQHSDRANAPFIAVNCAAVPETLLESELFGHEKGSFTGAQTRRIGRFEQANGGVIFLDEIGDMTPATQVKLNRVLQEKCLQRLGGKEMIPLDVRIIAATHRDLAVAIKQGLFREDLYYRLRVIDISVPPLRDRREDIPALIAYFLRKHGPTLGAAQPSIHPEAVEFLQSHSWPGNVRELENVILKALVFAQNFTIDLGHVRAALNTDVSPVFTGSLAEFIDKLLAGAERGEILSVHARVMEAAERELITRAIVLAQGNQAQAARWLGITRVTMKAKLVQFGLHSSDDPTTTA